MVKRENSMVAMKAVIVDCLGRTVEGRRSTVDVIGAGPRRVAGVLEKLGLTVSLVPFELFVRELSKYKKYDVVLASAMSSDINVVKHLSSTWHRTTTILGGPVAAGCIEKKTLYGYTLAVLGEGEKTLEELFNRQVVFEEGVKIDDLPNIRGIIFKRSDGKICFTGFREFLTRSEIDNYKSSIEAIRGYPLYWAARVYVEVVRGCSNFNRPRTPLKGFNKCINCGNCESSDFSRRMLCPVKIPPGCGYCSVPVLYGPARSRSINRIVEEVEDLIEIGVTRIVLGAPDILDYGRDWLVEPQPLTNPSYPPPNTDALEALFSELTSIKRVERGEACILLENVKANLVNEETARLLGKYFRNSPIHIGCETGSARHAKIIGRPALPSHVIRAVKLLSENGLRPYVYFIHSLPYQNESTVNATIRVMRRVVQFGAEKITVYKFRPLPLTAFSRMLPKKSSNERKLARKIVAEARRLNMALKKRIVGRVVRIIVVSSYEWRGRKYALAYPLTHGPVVLLPQACEKFKGFVGVARIKKVFSDRIVYGEPIYGKFVYRTLN